MAAAHAGILQDTAISDLIGRGAISFVSPKLGLVDGQVQPASLDLKLGARAHRIRASFLPGPGTTVRSRLAALTLHEIDLTGGAVLETGCVYVVPLAETLRLPRDLVAAANPKSSTGRLDVFTRVISDGGRAFDQIEAGYAGELFLEISPRTFPVLARPGSRLSQLRFRRGDARLDDEALAELQARERLVDAEYADLAGGVAVGVDLAGFGPQRLVGYRAKRHTGVIDVDRREAYDVADFWDPIPARPDLSLILDPGEFYILASREAVHVPPDHAAEMVPFDPLVGEFRVHYAGFFDPGFGHAAAGGRGARAVLEVRSRDVPFIIGHGQIVGRLVYERMAGRPRALYGADLQSNYQGQALKLSKHFRAVTA